MYVPSVLIPTRRLKTACKRCTVKTNNNIVAHAQPGPPPMVWFWRSQRPPAPPVDLWACRPVGLTMVWSGGQRPPPMMVIAGGQRPPPPMMVWSEAVPPPPPCGLVWFGFWWFCGSETIIIVRYFDIWPVVEIWPAPAGVETMEIRPYHGRGGALASRPYHGTGDHTMVGGGAAGLQTIPW